MLRLHRCTFRRKQGTCRGGDRAAPPPLIEGMNLDIVRGQEREEGIISVAVVGETVNEGQDGSGLIGGLPGLGIKAYTVFWREGAFGSLRHAENSADTLEDGG